MTQEYEVKTSRRLTLQWVASMSIVMALPRTTKAEARNGTQRLSSLGYGRDPDMGIAAVPWPLIMSATELHKTAVISDLILPGTTSAPAPSSIGIAEFINEWISAPYEEQLRDRSIVRDGLGWLDTEAIRRNNRTFLASTEEIRRSILDDLSTGSSKSFFAQGQLLFRRLRVLVVGAYYTTPEGFRDIGYTGNVPLAGYAPVTDQERAILDGALTAIGLDAQEEQLS